VHAAAAATQRRLNMTAIIKNVAVTIITVGVPMYLGAELIGPGA